MSAGGESATGSALPTVDTQMTIEDVKVKGQNAGTVAMTSSFFLARRSRPQHRRSAISGATPGRIASRAAITPRSPLRPTIGKHNTTNKGAFKMGNADLAAVVAIRSTEQPFHWLRTEPFVPGGDG